MVSKKIKSFEDLEIWQMGHRLSIRIYQLTKGFPGNEVYGLASQTRRASVSVPANIVEGYYRNTTKELINFYIMQGGRVEKLSISLYYQEI